MGETEFQPVDVRCQVDVVAICMFVHHDAGVVSGHDNVPQDGQSTVIASRSDQPARSMVGLEACTL